MQFEIEPHAVLIVFVPNVAVLAGLIPRVRAVAERSIHTCQNAVAILLDIKVNLALRTRDIPVSVTTHSLSRGEPDSPLPSPITWIGPLMLLTTSSREPKTLKAFCTGACDSESLQQLF